MQHEKEDLQKLTDLGCIIFASAGNHENAWDFTGVLYPAAYVNVLSVGAYRREPRWNNAKKVWDLLSYKWEASNALGNLSEHKNGRNSVDIYAPGRNVIACVPLYLSLLELQVQSVSPNVRFYGKTPLSGTSMAAPIMSATLAVYLRRNPVDSLLTIVEAFRKVAVPCVNQEMGLSIGDSFPK